MLVQVFVGGKHCRKVAIQKQNWTPLVQR